MGGFKLPQAPQKVLQTGGVGGQLGGVQRVAEVQQVHVAVVEGAAHESALQIHNLRISLRIGQCLPAAAREQKFIALHDEGLRKGKLPRVHHAIVINGPHFF